MKKVSGIILILIALVMIYVGIAYKMLPPPLTGIGFIFIGVVFILDNKSRKTLS